MQHSEWGSEHSKVLVNQLSLAQHCLVTNKHRCQWSATMSIADVSGGLRISSKFYSMSLSSQHPGPDRFSWQVAKTQWCMEACNAHWSVDSELSYHHFIIYQPQSKWCGWAQSQRRTVLWYHMVKDLITNEELRPFFQASTIRETNRNQVLEGQCM